MLFGKREVWAIVTKSEKGKQRRLFLCAKDPKEIHFDLSLADAKAALFANADADFLPLTIYGLRWNIETAYYEQKTFWALGDYRLRSKVGIERPVNLLTLCYSTVKLLPYSCGDFCALRGFQPPTHALYLEAPDSSRGIFRLFGLSPRNRKKYFFSFQELAIAGFRFPQGCVKLGNWC